MKKKLLSMTLVALLTAAMFAGCGSSTESAETTDAAATETTEASDEAADTAAAADFTTVTDGVLTMATNAYFPPYEYYEGEEIVGIDAEIAAAVADKLGLTLKIEDMEFDSIITAVSTGKADIGMAGMTVTEDRLKNINFSSTYAPDLPVSLEKIILKATMKSPDRRYNTISDMLIDLKKSLVSPNEDFVNIVDANNLANTRVASQEEQVSITKKAAEALQLDFVDDYDGKREEVRNFNANRKDFYDDEDEYEDDDYEDEKSDKIMTILGVVAGIAIVVILIVILGNVFGLFNFGSSNKIAMIDVVGEEYETAITDLTAAGFAKDNISVEYEESSTYNDGIVTDQSVDEGKKIKADAEITLTVAGSADSKESSEESSDKSEDTKESSDSSSDTKTKTDSSSQSADTKTSTDTQTSTDTSTTTTTTTDTSASSSSKTVNVPSVAGLSQADATNTLQNAKLIVTSVTSEYSDNVEAGKVISQSIAAGQQVAENTNITLVVSKGKKAETYTVYCINPYADDATYTLETGQTGSVKGSGTVTVNNSPKAQLSCTFSHTVTDETTGEKKTEEQTLTFTGTAN